MPYPSRSWILGEPPKIPIPGMEGFGLRFHDPVINTVVFIGYSDPSSPGGIKCTGSGLLLTYQDEAYLVTARHVVASIAGAPFLVRTNRWKSGGSNVVVGDEVVWHYHQNESVDLAIAPFRAMNEHGFEAIYLNE